MFESTPPLYYAHALADEEEEIYFDEEIRISGLCRMSYPCTHMVYRKQKDGSFLSSCECGSDIVKDFIKKNKPVPEHFHYLVNSRCVMWNEGLQEEEKDTRKNCMTRIREIFLCGCFTNQ
jgi:hypothetical protein